MRRTTRAGSSATRSRALTIVAALVLVAAGSPASSEAAFTTGLDDFAYQSADPATRSEWFDKTVAAGAGLVRLNLLWRNVAPVSPSTPTDPADPAYDFSRVDAAVRDATARGLKVLITIYSAPDWAEGPDRSADAPPGTWRPDPAAFGLFAQAVASRYSGSFNGLPRVRYFEAWNEPNLPQALNPQWDGKRPVSPKHYREMLRAFYSGVKAVDGSNVVLAGSLAPYGDPPNTFLNRMRPLVFFRKLLCLGGSPKGDGCRPKPAFDVLSDHPINLSGGPRTSAVSPDDVSSPDVGRLREVLRDAERRHAIGGGKRHHAIWATEIWWESNPPDPDAKAGLSKQARWVEESFFLLWKEGVKAVVNLPLVDAPVPEPHIPGILQSGLFLVDGTPKPSLQAFRFPFVTERESKRELFAWGKAPRAGALRIEQRAGGRWKTVARQKVRAGGIFTARLRVKGKAKLRASVGGELSLVWSQR